MSLAAKATNRFSRRLSVPISVLQYLSAIGETSGKKARSNTNPICFQDFRRQSFSTQISSDAHNNGMSTTNEKQDQDSTLIERTDKNIFQRVYEKYSMPSQTNRILVAESLFQAATSQASDP